MEDPKRLVTQADRRHIRTDRLVLDALTAADLDPMHELHADPQVWRHLPSGRHTTREQTVQFLAGKELDWATGGLGYWGARSSVEIPGGPAAGTFIGVGGCAVRFGLVWNLYYRLAPTAWGFGFAGEIAAAGLEAAAAVNPALPVVAYLLEHNVGSKRTAERAGLQQMWRGPDAGNPDPAAVRLIYADRALDPVVLGTLVASS